MQSSPDCIIELLEMLKIQEELISNQNNMIISLLNQNAEQENMINVLMTEFKE